MCFNLGALNSSTIESQKSYPISSHPGGAVYPYIHQEDSIWGSLFQWGRIADGHEKRWSETAVFSGMQTADITSGNICPQKGEGSPYCQIAKTSNTWYGKFVVAGSETNYNWNALYANPDINLLWRSGIYYIQNDPCTHYKDNGTYQGFWNADDSDACANDGAGWRLPSIDEWSAIYKGEGVSGTPASATANTWSWHGGTNEPITNIRGFEISPDNVTATLFLPTTGCRQEDGQLRNRGSHGFYWSSSVTGTNAYALFFGGGNLVYPGYNNYRSFGFGIRCIKNI
jgi:uncharacterized protein (TIGR02145 family)